MSVPAFEGHHGRVHNGDPGSKVTGSLRGSVCKRKAALGGLEWVGRMRGSRPQAVKGLFALDEASEGLVCP